MNMDGLVGTNTMGRQIHEPANVIVGPAHRRPVSHGPRYHVMGRAGPRIIEKLMGWAGPRPIL